MTETKQTSDINLLPCPFCGGEADPKEVAYTQNCDDHKEMHFSPGCTVCGASVKTIKLWNTRIFKSKEIL